MGYLLTGDQLRTAAKRIGEIQRQLGQGEYPYDPERLLTALHALIEGRFDAVGGLFPSTVIAAKYGYTVVEDVTPSSFDIAKLVPRQFVEDGKGLNGKGLRDFARQNGGNLGLVDGVRMIGDDCGNKIPASFHGSYIPLPGTLLRDSDDDSYLAYLHCNGGEWELNFVRLDDGWNDFDRLACSESVT